MTQRIRLWLVATVLFTLVNAVGGGFALAGSEMLHAGSHFVLMALGTYAVWRLASRNARVSAHSVPLADDRLEQLQQSVDVVAIEIERLGEAQRYNAKREAERVDASQ